MALDRLNPFKWNGLASTKYRFYRTWVTVRPVGSTKTCRPRDNSGYIQIRLTVQEREPEEEYKALMYLGTQGLGPLWTGSTTFDEVNHTGVYPPVIVRCGK
ncbi:hypothetical protein PIB30_044688 [Stylosanthes scabra]|uniref:Uncharacterized protein n=1 Tax=Stylosanthes scabra TaxID=79078 RepID=A0ABU6RG18_9FABA|nr:hypothetical protein [Stylosanthes scabra]